MRYPFLIFIFLQLFLFGCNSKLDSNRKPFYIIEHPKLNPEAVLILENDDTTYIPTPPPPPPVYYGNYNFILLGTDQIFFHTKIGPWYWCGTGVDYDKPEKLNLVPDNFQQIKLAELQKFLSDSIKSDTLQNGRKTFVKIASPEDTIYNPAFQLILEHLKSKGIRRYVIKNSTEEENCVIYSILEKKPFDREKCDFKVGFGGISFTPPVQSDSTE